jgi:glycosyltransferase involved in cell wall biosynthesis
MKALMLIPHVGLSGAWTVVRTLSRELKTRGYTCYLAGDGVAQADRAVFDRTFQLLINRKLKGLLLSLKEIFRFDRDIQVIHVHSTNSLLFAYLLRFLRCRKAAIVFSYHWDVVDTPFIRLVKKELYSRCDLLHCATSELGVHFKKLYRQDSAHIVRIPLGADEKVFYPADQQEKIRLRREFHLNPESFVILFVGRLDPEKNLDLVLRTLSENRYKELSVKLLIAGGGPLLHQLQRRTEELDLKNRVIFLGTLTSLRDVYAVSDLLVLPSNRGETFGLVVIEAALCGVPALRSNTFGAIDQIVDGVNGAIFDLKDPGSFSTRLYDLLSSSERLKQMGDEAYRLAIQKFTSAGMAREFDQVFRNLTIPKSERPSSINN